VEIAEGKTHSHFIMMHARTLKLTASNCWVYCTYTFGWVLS